MMHTATAASPEVIDAEANIFAPLAQLKQPAEARLTRAASGFLVMVRSFVIQTRDDYALAAEELGSIKAMYKAGEAERVSFTGPLNLVLDRLNAKYQPPLKMLLLAEQTIKEDMGAFDAEQERIRVVKLREAERIAQLERDRLAEEARERERVAQVELLRLAAIELQRKQAAEAEQTKLDDAARAAAAAGNAAAAAAAHSQALAVAERNANAAAAAAEQAAAVSHAAAVEVNAIEQQQAVVIAAPPAGPVKVAGVTSVKALDFEVQDLEALIKDIVLNQPQFLALLRVDEVKLRAQVKALGANLKIKGLRVFDKRTIRSSAAVA